MHACCLVGSSSRKANIKIVKVIIVRAYTIEAVNLAGKMLPALESIQYA